MMTFDELEMTWGHSTKKLGYTHKLSRSYYKHFLSLSFRLFVSSRKRSSCCWRPTAAKHTDETEREENELPHRLFASQRLSAFHTDDECDQKTSPATCGTCKKFPLFFLLLLLAIGRLLPSHVPSHNI